MRVLHAASFYGTTAGGFVPLMCALARELNARGDAMALVAPDVAAATWHDAARGAGIELHLVEGARDAVRFARAWRPDVAHLHFFGWEGRLTTALWLRRTRIFWHVHSTVTSRPRGRVAASPRSMAKYRVLGARVERFVAVSAAIRDELVRQGAPRERVVLVPNAVDTRRFRPPSAAERAAARTALGLGDAPAILFFGRDPRIKGADVLARALPSIADAVVIAVATPGGARDALARHAGVIALEQADDVVPLMWAADALAMPSRAEGFGLVLLEASHTGLPVAASDLAALRETAEGCEGVHFAAAGDAAAFAAALRASLDEQRLRPPAPSHAGDPLAAWARSVMGLYDDARS